jgi:DNA-directed RNA polymerase sigma subunit (sigma70/sigma32)
MTVERRRAMDLNEPEQLESYIRSVLEIPPVNLNQIGSLIEAVQQGQSAETLLIETHLRLVVEAIESIGTSPLSKLDLLQEGNIGLMVAVRGYSGSPELFVQYATTCIRQSIDRAIKDADSMPPSVTGG